VVTINLKMGTKWFYSISGAYNKP